MKIKLIAALGLSATVLLGACGGGANTNTNTNANVVVVATPTPIVKTTESATVDPNMKPKIEAALKAKGFTTVTVDTTTSTLRGTYPKGKLDQVVQTVTEAAGKPFKNEMTEAK